MTTSRPLVLALALLAGLSTAGTALADCSSCTHIQATSSSQLVPVTDKTDAAWLAKARADYPLNSCSVSGDKFDGGEMTGPPRDFIYREAGKPDRLVRFCCKGCIKDFNKDPAKYLKIIDDAAAAKGKDTGGAPMK
ncbi:MAG TPA: hypothetical protein VNW30_01450 [Opitutaceae bacterium]|jgi:hypothetical protein|nr:hypothetical protein [Opitutaceae bacterium]